MTEKYLTFSYIFSLLIKILSIFSSNSCLASLEATVETSRKEGKHEVNTSNSNTQEAEEEEA